MMWTNRGSAMHGPLESPVVAPVTALVRLLDELRDVINRVPDDVFARPPAGRPSGSIGAHVRHCLDHIGALLEGALTGRTCYDRRARGTEVETVRRAALDRIRALTEAVLDLDPRLMSRVVRLQVTLDTRGTTTEAQSTVVRELIFVISHTIHHNATIGLLLSETGADLPSRFGIAPATPSPPGRVTMVTGVAPVFARRSGADGSARTTGPDEPGCIRNTFAVTGTDACAP